MSLRVDQKLEVQQATDIVDLVGQHIALEKKGREYVGLCPFHDDHRPSMSVVPHKQIFHCFVCGSGGNVFSFVMKYHQMGFREALTHLAERAGIRLASHTGPATQDSERTVLLETTAQAMACFRKALEHPELGRAARRYIQERRIGTESAGAFALGYAPDRWDWLEATVRREGWNLEAFAGAGLVLARSSGQGHYDRFRHRLIFPICDTIGRPIAFGARRLRDEDEPKYLNSPESLLFDKSATLYGMHLAREAIIKQRTAVVVEGYTDVIACHDAGIRHVVATLGTALTARHVLQLRRYCDRAVLIFDPDDAGQLAADRAVTAFMEGNLDVAIAILPAGRDPAQLLAEPDGLEQWNRAVEEASDALAYQFQRVRGQFSGAATIRQRQQVGESYLRRLSELGLQRQGPIRRALIIKQVAELLGLDAKQVVELIERLPSTRSRPVSAPQQVGPGPGSQLAWTGSAPRIAAIQSAEWQVIGALLRQPDLFGQELADGRSLRDAVPPSLMVTATSKQLYEHIYDHLCHSEQLTLNQLLADLTFQDKQDLVELATAIDTDMDRFSDADGQGWAPLVRGAAEALGLHQREHHYQRMRAAVIAEHKVNDPVADQQERLLRQLVEQRRQNRRPSHIGRVRSP